MDRAEKEKYVEDLRRSLSESGATFLAEFTGIKSTPMNEFRGALRDVSAEFRVVRNTLARRALAGSPQEVLTEHLKGPVAIAFSREDAVMAAKRLVEFAKDQPGLKFKAAVLGDRVLDPGEIKALAALPGKDVLMGRLLGSISAPISGLVGVLAGVQRKFLYTLNAIGQGKA